MFANSVGPNELAQIVPPTTRPQPDLYSLYISLWILNMILSPHPPELDLYS